MRYARGLLAVLVIVMSVSEAQGQAGVMFRGRRLTTSLYLGGPYGFGGWGRPYLYGSPWWGPRYTGFAFVQPPPVIAPPPVIINNPPPIINVQPDQPQIDLINPIVIRPRNDLPHGPMPEAPLPGAPRGNFRPVLPEDRAQAERPARQLEQPRVPQPAEPAENPQVEGARQLAFGKQAFLARQYGQAERRFQEAARLLPKDAVTPFLLAQTQMVLGKYQEAVSSIHAGLRLKPDWPGSTFRPIELYGPNVADYAEHLELLRDAHRLNPQDPVLLFLLAYQLWFDGQKEEARVLFRQAAARVADPSFIDLFLRQDVPGDRVVMR